MADSKPVSETGWPYNDKVQCAKRIMEAVDTYHERPDALNRAALRSVILTELDEYAAGVALPAKPFPAPGKWFPVDITGTRPMREVSPGKWELAEWPSDGVREDGND